MAQAQLKKSPRKSPGPAKSGKASRGAGRAGRGGRAAADEGAGAAAVAATGPAAPKKIVRLTAADLAEKQREISVSEFFTKNRHLLGFDSPAKALLTTVKEAVDNALDACEEAGILPDL